MLKTFTPSPFQGIMEQSLTELEDACNEPLAPDPRTMEADFMLPENAALDYRISTTTTEDFEDEFECDRCDSAFYRLITRFGVSYARCTECGWVAPNVLVDAIASVGGVG
jgi:predicted RNA-binding Zn-ribbon protein involved in translation (DUF1610 family)